MTVTHHTRPVLPSLLVFVLLAAAHTWPLAAAPAHWSRIDGDGGLNTWAVSWVAHALLEDPRHIFDANIFYPEPLTLAYSESMLLQSLFAVPVIAFNGSAVLAYSVSALAGFVLTGWAFCLLVWRWTGSWAAGFVAGSLAAFNAYTLVNLTHLQFLHSGFIALALFALDRLIAAPRLRDTLWLAAGFALQALTSLYMMVFTTLLLSFALLGRVGEWTRSPRRLAAHLAAAATIAALLLAPYFAPYWRLNGTQHLARTADEAESGSWRNFVSTAANVHYGRWSRALSGGSATSVFPGFAALALAAIAFASRQDRRDPRVRMCAVAAAGCAGFSFTPSLPFYRLLYAVNPLLHVVRAVDRIAHLWLLMLAIVAGYGVAALGRRFGTHRAWPVAAVVLLLIVNGEAVRAPIKFIWFDGVPAVYDVLAKEPGAVVAEIPFPMPRQWFLNSPYMVNSTRHWRPILNGYSGFRPPTYDAAYEASRGFPSDESLIALHKRGVTHVVVHLRAFNNGGVDDRYDPFAHVASLSLLARDEDTLIYRIRR